MVCKCEGRQELPPQLAAAIVAQLHCIYILAWYLCIYMHRESGSDSEVDPIVKLIWSKVCITIYITISITSLITIVA